MTKQFILHEDEPGGKTAKIAYAKELNQEQLGAVLDGDGACLVLAGAGSGKTRTITYRVAYLIEQGIDPRQILLLTFTNKASKEMLERVERLLGASVHGIWGGTFHSIANRLLRVHADAIGIPRTFTIIDSDDAQSMIRLVMKEMRIDPKARRFPSPGVTMGILSYARNTCQSVAEAIELKNPHFQDLAGDIEEIGRRYEERKRASHSLDFDDLLTHLLALLEDPLRGPSISSIFRYVLVDEYQDTNAIQARIVDRFASASGNCFVVGDDAQSIYGFRGADVQNILNFPNEHPNAKVFKLLTNYRSTPEILDLANASLKHNLDQFEKDLSGLRKGGERPSYIPCASARQEAQYVAEQILQLHASGTPLNRIAVLFRATSHSQQLELELMKRDIPYEYRGGVTLFERAHIKDVLAFLRVVHNVKDEQAWLRLLLLQPGIGAVTAERIARDAREVDSITAIADGAVMPALSEKARIGWAGFLEILKDVAANAPLPSGMIRAVASSSYQDHLEKEYPNWRDRLDDIEQFALFAEQYADLTAFLAEISLYDSVYVLADGNSRPAVSSDVEKIVCSTIHQAKGLEWDTVFIIHLAEGSFPNKRALGEEGGLEEERRLFYVAVTRAERRLFITYPLTSGFDALVLNRQSTFIDEIDPRLYERIELVESPRMSPGRSLPRSSSSWDWDGGGSIGGRNEGGGGYHEPTIELDRYGERRPSRPSLSPGDENRGATKTAWKSSGDPKKKLPPTSYLSNW
jgi:DNA helicase II / ATP-dependent DNA helicase PcrA